MVRRLTSEELEQMWMKITTEGSLFCDITPVTPLKVNRRFGGTCRLYLYISACYLPTGRFLSLIFDHETGGEMFLENVAWLSTDCAAYYPRR
jgi:hypothetical protein